MKNTKANNNEKENKDTIQKTIMMIIIIIIIILSLITSCSCTSNFFGKIGDMFRNESDHNITDGSKDKEKIRNQNLRFNESEIDISVSDTKAKLGYTYENIDIDNLTCKTSDASIATCYVGDGYVIINPKKPGQVTVTLSTETSDKIYEASAIVNIGDATRYLKFSNNSGTINLANTKTKTVSYYLVGLTGKVTVTSSNESVAKAVIKNNVVIITAYKTGKANITISLESNGMTYSDTYKLNVINRKGSTGGSVNILDDNSLLKSLTTNKGTINFDKNTFSYAFGVNWWNGKVTLDAIPESDKATVSYTFNGEPVSSLKNLKLKTGDNIVVITVTAEDGTTSIYQVVINKPPFASTKLKDIVSSVPLSPKFDPNTLKYTATVDNSTDKISLEGIPKSSNAKVYHTFYGDGKTYNSIEDMPLKEGLNTILITVVGINGDKRTYTVEIYREHKNGVLDSNSLLSNLATDAGNIDFIPNKTEYSIGVPANKDSMNLTAIPDSDKYKDITITLDGREIGKNVTSISDIPLHTGENVIKVTVTAEDGSQTTYTLVVNKNSGEKDHTLSNLTIGNYDIGFEENTTEYNLIVGSDVSEVDFTAIPKGTAKIAYYLYNGVRYEKDELKTLNLGDKNKLEIVVKSEDGSITTSYVVNISRAKEDPTLDSDSTLKDLLIEPTIKGLNFESNKGTYNLSVGSNVDSIKITGIPNSPNAQKVIYIIDGKEVDPNDIKLEEGKTTTVTIKVIAEDGSCSTPYTVNIFRDSSKYNTSLDTLTTNKGDFTPKFDPNVIDNNYKITVPSDTDEIDIIASAHDSNAEITYIYDSGSNKTGEVPLGYGDNFIYVQVKNGDVTKTYKVNVIREMPSKDAYLTKLTGDYPITPELSKDNFNYYTEVTANTNTINFEAIPNDKGTITGITWNGESVTSLSGLAIDKDKEQNILTITVTSEDGQVSNTYNVYVKVPKEENPDEKPIIEITTEDLTVDIKNSTFPVDYTVKNVTTIDPDKISVKFIRTDTGETVSLNYDKSTPGHIIVSPISANSGLLGIPIKMSVSYDDKTTDDVTIKFVNENYNIIPEKYDYSIYYTNTKPQKLGFVLDLIGNMFPGEFTVKQSNGQNIQICDVNVCVNVDIVKGSDILSIDYTGENRGPLSELGITMKPTQNGTGTAEIAVSWEAFGQKHKLDKNITVKVSKWYTVSLNAGNGVFDEINNQNTWQRDFAPNTKFDLTAFKPYIKVEDNACMQYALSGWTSNDTVNYKPSYTLADIETPIEVVGDVTFTATYSTSQSDLVDETERIWYLTNDTIDKDSNAGLDNSPINLFYNKEYYEAYGKKEKIIYPGAHGEYLFNFTNNSSNKIEITGIILEEDTICVDANGNEGCLNMGYTLSHKLGNTLNYYGPSAFNKDSVLNMNDGIAPNIKDWKQNYNRKDIEVSQDVLVDGVTTKRGIIIDKGDSAMINLQWMWIDFDDEKNNAIDTKIGTQASESQYDSSINDKYKLYLGIKYRFINEDCE